MLFKTLLPALTVVVCACGISASPQATTVLPFLGQDGDDVGTSTDDSEIISAVIVGTGASGETTYVLDVGDGESSDIAKATLVEGASAMTAIIAFTDDQDEGVVTESIACGFNDGNADCTVAMVGVFDSVTTTLVQTSTGVAGSITLAVSTSIASPTDSASASGSSQSSSAGRLAGGRLIAGFSALGLTAFVLA